MSRILLADNNPVLRAALALLLETRLNAQIVGQVNSMESLLIEAADTRPDIIIFDWELPGEPGVSRVEALRSAAPSSRIIITSTRMDAGSLAAGADGFICRFDPPEIIISTIRGE